MLTIMSSESSESHDLSRFAKGVSGISPTLELLFGNHICDLLRARSAMEQRLLRASPCKKFDGEELLYLFYGKPSFRPDSAGEGKRFGAFYPVCFVVRLDASVQLRRVFPFDSGAFPKRYSEFLHQKMSLEDFLMPADYESARRIVAGFYASNSDYFDSKPLLPFRAVNTLETSTYFELVKAFGSGQKLQGDDRLVAIELQASGAITLDATRICRIILPDKALEFEDIRAALEGCGIDFEHYRTGALAPHECHAFINDRVRAINELR
jgi:hypothetical protein